MIVTIGNGENVILYYLTLHKILEMVKVCNFKLCDYNEFINKINK